MSSGFSNQPQILRGAFVEYGLSIPPLFVVFQFNPVQLSRNRSLSFSPPNAGDSKGEAKSSLREFHQGKGLEEKDSLLEIQEKQQVTLQEETINFEIRLDATDKLNEGDTITEQ